MVEKDLALCNTERNPSDKLIVQLLGVSTELVVFFLFSILIITKFIYHLINSLLFFHAVPIILFFII